MRPVSRHRSLQRQMNTLQVPQKGAGISEFLFGKSTLPNHVQSMLDQHGKSKIVNLSVCRVPIEEGLERAMNLASLGQLEKLKKSLHYDKLFHLFLRIETDTGSIISLEKNEILTMLENPDQFYSTRGVQCLPVALKKQISVSELLDKTIANFGEDVLHYDLVTNNCQTFLNQVLFTNGLLTDKLNKFINQDIRAISAKLPTGLTWLATKLVRLTERLRYLTGEGKGNAPLIPF